MCKLLVIFGLLAFNTVIAGELINPIKTSDALDDTWRKAVQSNRIDILEQNLNTINDIDLPSRNGKTALMAAAFKGADDLVAALIKKGANVNQRNHLLGSPLMYAAGAGDVATIKLLLQHGADINHQSVNGWNALMMAVAKNHMPVVEQLCRLGADVNKTDVYGWTALMRAAFEGRQSIVEVLLAQPAIDIERINDHGQNALHLAVSKKQTRIVALLLLQGAQQTADFAGNTPQSIARTLGHDALINQLRE